METSEHHDMVCDRLRSLPGVETDLLFLWNSDNTKVSVQALYLGEWVTSEEVGGTEAAAFDLIQRLVGDDG